MEAQTADQIAAEFDAAVTSESNYVEPKPSTDVDRDADDAAEKAAAARDDKGRFAGKPDAKADDAAAAEAKAGGEKKPRNDAQARIDQAIGRQRDAERRLEEAERRAQDAERRASTPRQAEQRPVEQPKPDKFPRFDEWSAQHADKTHDDYLDARDEWRDQRLAQQASAQQDKSRREQAFSTRAATFSERYAAAREADPDVETRIDRRLLTAKPFSTLTSDDKALIKGIPDPRAREEFAFLCFLADQWIDSEHAVALLEHVSDPKQFQRLATLPPNVVIRELARIEAGFAAASSKESRGSVSKPSASQAHPPIKPLGSASRVPDADDGSDDEPIESFIRRENTKDRKSGRLG